MAKKKKEQVIESELVEKKDLKTLGEEFEKWCKKPDSYKWTTFFVNQGICPSDVFLWCSENKDFEKKIEVGKYMIGERREILAFENKRNAAIVIATMPLYDKEFFDYKLAQLKNQANSQGNIKVSFETYQTPANFPKKENK